MLDWVPEPVWNTTSGKCSSSCPLITSSAALTMGSAMASGSSPSLRLARAAAFFRMPMLRIIGAPHWKRARPMGKLWMERSVWAPQYLLDGTEMEPIESDSRRMWVVLQ